MVRLILFAAATLLLAGPVAAEEVRLVCLGTGTHAEETRAFSQTFDNTGFPNGLGDILGTRAVSVFDAATVEIVDGAGRIRVPPSILPAVRGAGDGDGVWRLYDLRVSEGAITARFDLNFFDKPRLSIDRRTGRISIRGYRDSRFEGECQPFEP